MPQPTSSAIPSVDIFSVQIACRRRGCVNNVAMVFAWNSLPKTPAPTSKPPNAKTVQTNPGLSCPLKSFAAPTVSKIVTATAGNNDRTSFLILAFILLLQRRYKDLLQRQRLDPHLLRLETF